ncbi:DUF1772 domain-containing protein [Terrarubrum flagellatum]|uniref:anthrone oxygenase family protein n=1 Tax=Terrirubrum flagellatum TaxID=2895980 RepID=UPI00314561A2
MAHIVFILLFAAAIGSGVVGGMFYAFSSFVMAALGRIAPEQGVAAMNAINVTVITPSFMVFFLGTALLCLILGGGAVFGWGGGGAKFILAASVLYFVGCFGATVIFNVPLNDQLAAVTPADQTAVWVNYLDRWTMWNSVRAAASILSAILFTIALLMG